MKCSKHFLKKSLAIVLAKTFFHFSTNGAIFRTFQTRAKDLGESVDEDQDEPTSALPSDSAVNNDSQSKIILGTSNKNFVAEEKTLFMGLNLRSRKASMPVFQVQ